MAKKTIKPTKEETLETILFNCRNSLRGRAAMTDKRNTEEELRLFYYNKGVEVDFCVPKENLAVQVSYNIDDAETYEREVGGLVKFLKAFKSYHGTIVTWDTSSTVEEDGISVTVIPIWEWLLI